MATRRWVGNATAVKQVDTITITGTWAQNDTATLTINGKDLVITIGTLTSTTQVATTIKEAWEGETLTDTSASVSPTIALGGGTYIPEMREITATSSTNVVTLTGDTAGKPFTVTTSETTASSDGDVGDPSTDTAATGPHHFDNADNWSGATVPVDSDDIWFDAGDVDLKYALSQSSITPASINITMGYTGKIGLPEYNKDTSGFTYREYREKYLILGDSTDATNIAVDIGAGDGQGSGRIKLDCNDSQCTVNVRNTGQTAESGVPAFLWKGTDSSNEFNITKGTAGIAYYADDSATLATLRIGYQTNQIGDSSVECGESVTLSSCTMDVTGGEVITRSNLSTSNVNGGTHIHQEGTLGTLNLDGGSCIYSSNGTMTTANVGSDGVLDFRRDMRSRTVTNCSLYDGAGYRDPNGTVTHTNDIDLVRCSISDLSVFEHAPNKTIGFSAI